MPHKTWESLKERFIGKLNSMILRKSELKIKKYELKVMSLLGYSLLIFNFSLLVSCYSFRGTSLDPNLKTIQIQNFAFQTAGGPANLSLTFNEKLKEYFQRNTSLKTTTTNPDLMFEGAITGFEVEAKAPTADDKGGLNRLTIRVQVKFTNAKNEDKNYDQELFFIKILPKHRPSQPYKRN